MSEIVDLVFPLIGDELRADYALPLWRQLRVLLPWLEDEAAAGILPIKGGNHSNGRLVLGQRAQLTLRLPQARLTAAAAITGASLDLDAELRLGEPKPRDLRPTPAQYSTMVVLEGDGEADFVADCERQLAAMAISAGIVCGKTQARTGETGELRGYSLMLHGLSREHALRLLQMGMGNGRKLGCGIFVPHKTALAVGS